MLTRRLASLIALVAAVGLAASGCAQSSEAVRVGDQSISLHDFEDQLDVVYANEALLGFLFEGATPDQIRPEGAPRGTYPQNFVGGMAGVQAQFLVTPSIAADQGLEITDRDRQDAVQTLEQQAPGALDEMPESVGDSYIEGLAAIQVLQAQVDPDELQAVFTEGFQAADVEVSSRYGSWDDLNLRVDPPPGPRPAPGTPDTSGAGLSTG